MENYSGMTTKKATSNIREILGKNLRQKRIEKQISQEELAEIAGLHRTYIGSVERGERNISIDNIEKLCKALNMSIKELLSE